MSLLGALWCRLAHDVWTVKAVNTGECLDHWKVCSQCGRYLRLLDSAPLNVPAPPAFDWLREYGPLWEPGSTAFWLAPDTDEQLAAWRAKYEAPRVRDVIDVRKPFNPYANQYANQYNQLAALQQQAQYAGSINGLAQQGYNSNLLGLGSLLGSKF